MKLPRGPADLAVGATRAKLEKSLSTLEIRLYLLGKCGNRQVVDGLLAVTNNVRVYSIRNAAPTRVGSCLHALQRLFDSSFIR
jgi:hypothetical protein